MDHAINTVVRDQKVTTAGYQGVPAPNQWFGGPALSSMAGNMVLRDAAGNVVDGLNYGGLVDPWTAEGYQAASGAGESGCSVPSPGMSRGFRFGPSLPASQPNRSAGRYPDGADSDNNCRDFLLQNTVYPVSTRQQPVQTILKSPVWQTLSLVRRLLSVQAQIARPLLSRLLVQRVAPQ